ncbi:MAG: DUF4335 domain-containing protein [Cyanobacteria bacterium J06598_1]
MTIRRQYQLPNCSLILDGLSIDPSPGSENTMSLLVNAECRISGLERSLNGGYNFFAALVRAVSQYGQEVLSGFAHPQVLEGEPLLVHINPGDGPYHHLVVQPEIADLGEVGDSRAIDIKLSSVQLYDLTEAVDQFFADQQTLPELEPGLAPLARRFVRSDEPLSDRAIPVALGVGGLVAATMAFGMLPLPEMRDPALDAREPVESVEVAANDEPATAGTDAPPSGSEASSETAEDKAEDRAEETAAVPTEAPGETAAGETAAGETVAEATDASENDANEAPVAANAVDSDSDAEDASSEQTFDSFDDFKPEDTTEDSTEPSTVASAGTSAGATTFESEPPVQVNRFADVRSLNGALKQTIVDNRDQPRFGDAISYRVRVSEDGTVTGYEPVDSSAEGAISETPLPKLVGSSTAESAAIDYRVVFTERGVVEVSPWWGWSYYE